MIRELSIKNFKSVLDHTIEFGRVNVFIGENGCGKTNILEALAMVSAALEGKLDPEGLYSKGVRVAKPALTLSSFSSHKPVADIRLQCVFSSRITKSLQSVDFLLSTKDTKSTSATWIDTSSSFLLEEGITDPNPRKVIFDQMKNQAKRLGALRNSLTKAKDNLSTLESASLEKSILAMEEDIKHMVPIGMARMSLQKELLAGFAIYNIHTLALRGIDNISKKVPLGINGESLDVLVASFTKAERAEILRRAKMIPWLSDIIADTGDTLKFSQHKLGRSTSTLYFKDLFMRPKNNVFSAENANEGILHILFYLALFISKETPTVFGIDNIETALNPQLCRDLMKELVSLAKDHKKQALITTHNPAILDGLNLHDEDQRLFVVSRNDEGHTVTRRIKLKPEGKGPQGERLKLSELWMRGALGGIPQKF